MPVYVLLSSLTDEGAKTIRDNPDRISEVNRDVEAMGAKVLGQYATLGRYDFVNIVEAPDEETIARVSVVISARGGVRIETLTGIPIERFASALGKS